MVLADLGGLSSTLSELGGHQIDMQADVSDQIARAVKAVFKNDTLRISRSKGRTCSMPCLGRAQPSLLFPCMMKRCWSKEVRLLPEFALRGARQMCHARFVQALAMNAKL